MMSQLNVQVALGLAVIAVVLVGAGKAATTDACCATEAAKPAAVEVCCATGSTKTAEAGAKEGPALACTLSEAGQREAQSEVLSRLMIHAKSVTEKTDGYVIVFADGHAGEIVEYVERERACCRFFTFDLNFPAEGGAVNLRISGPDGAKDFLESMVSSWRESVDATD